ncbi:MAG: CDP-diacylglycerol--serine O-phosphatidyltransferase [Bacteroidaceae bacterium]|nr:CDP-diacylglycerol--serine O-phosphatidyltransferase [Bacteroidaceae bacterium]
MSMSFKKHIPNAITCCNLFSGCIACVMAFKGDFHLAMAFIVLGAFFDFFDGMAARLLGVSSPMGVQMDSLADDVTFGLAPATIVFSFMQTKLLYPLYLSKVLCVLPYAAFFIAVFSAYRLAKFNVDTRQTSTFIGLPTPANALFWSSLIAGGGEWLNSLNAGWVLLLVLIALFSYLLVSEIPMFSLKFKNLSWKSNRVRYIFLICCAPMLALGFLAPVAIISWYLILSVALHLRGTAV